MENTLTKAIKLRGYEYSEDAHSTIDDFWRMVKTALGTQSEWTGVRVPNVDGTQCYYAGYLVEENVDFDFGNHKFRSYSYDSYGQPQDEWQCMGFTTIGLPHVELYHRDGSVVYLEPV